MVIGARYKIQKKCCEGGGFLSHKANNETGVGGEDMDRLPRVERRQKAPKPAIKKKTPVEKKKIGSYWPHLYVYTKKGGVS